MLAATLLGLALTVASTLIHYEGLKVLNEFLPRLQWVPTRAKLLVVLLAAIASHLTQIVLFALVYYHLRGTFDLGGFAGQTDDGFATYLYFSAEAYTTLGLGDVYPLGPMRLITGLESLIGLLMIGWTPRPLPTWKCAATGIDPGNFTQAT